MVLVLIFVLNLSYIASAGSNFDVQSDLVVAGTSFKDLTAAHDNKVIGSDFILQLSF